MKFLRALLTLVGVLVLLAIAGTVIFTHYLKGKYEKPIYEARQLGASVVDNFCAEQTKLSRDPFFHVQRPSADAAEVLNKWVAWENSPGHALPPGSPLVIPAGLPQTNAELKEWLTQPLDVSKLDFSWMKELHKYDRWDISNWPGRVPGKFDAMAMPLPWFVSFQAWAKYRLLDGIARKDPVSASRDVQQLAWLSYRTDTLIGGVIAATLLTFERAAYEAHPELHSLEWQPMTKDELTRFKNVLWASVSLQHLAQSPAVAEKARSCGTPPVGACIGMAEAAVPASYMAPVIPKDLFGGVESLKKSVDSSGCTQLASTVLRDGKTISESGADPSALMGPDAPAEGIIRRMPAAFTREAIGGILIAISMPGGEKLAPFEADGGTP
ncbi:MAG: hypothetical protein ACJ790_12605 [Myxococcaceae bacterium]